MTSLITRHIRSYTNKEEYEGIINSDKVTLIESLDEIKSEAQKLKDLVAIRGAYYQK